MFSLTQSSSIIAHNGDPGGSTEEVRLLRYADIPESQQRLPEVTDPPTLASSGGGVRKQTIRDAGKANGAASAAI